MYKFLVKVESCTIIHVLHGIRDISRDKMTFNFVNKVFIVHVYICCHLWPAISRVPLIS